MLEEARDREEIIERVAALDIAKAEVVVCVRVPGSNPSGRRAQEIATYSTMTRSLLRLADRLHELGVTRVVMEATSDYWKPVFYLLEARGLDSVAGQRPRRQASAGAAEDRQAGCGVVVQTGRAADAAPEFRAAGADPPVKGSDPLSDRFGRCPYG